MNTTFPLRLHRTTHGAQIHLEELVEQGIYALLVVGSKRKILAGLAKDKEDSAWDLDRIQLSELVGVLNLDDVVLADGQHLWFWSDRINSLILEVCHHAGQWQIPGNAPSPGGLADGSQYLPEECLALCPQAKVELQ